MASWCQPSPRGCEVSAVSGTHMREQDQCDLRFPVCVQLTYMYLHLIWLRMVCSVNSKWDQTSISRSKVGSLALFDPGLCVAWGDGGHCLLPDPHAGTNGCRCMAQFELDVPHCISVGDLISWWGYGHSHRTSCRRLCMTLCVYSLSFYMFLCSCITKY